MPRWARSISCTLTGVLLSLIGFLLGAYWWEGGPRFWPEVLNFLMSPSFFSLSSLFGLLAASSLLLARITVNLYGVPGAVAGLVAGGLVALIYMAFLLAIHAPQWGGWGYGLQRSWPVVGLFAAPFAFAGAFTSWLWDRLDQ